MKQAPRVTPANNGRIRRSAILAFCVLLTLGLSWTFLPNAQASRAISKAGVETTVSASSDAESLGCNVYAADWYAVTEYGAGLGQTAPDSRQCATGDVYYKGGCYNPQERAAITGGHYQTLAATPGKTAPDFPQCATGDIYYRGGCYNPQEWAAITGGSHQTLPATPVIWEPYVAWSSQLFPSYLFATSTPQSTAKAPPYYLGDLRGLVGITITSPADNAEIKLLVTIPDIAESSAFDGVLSERGKSYRVNPEIAYNYQTLLAIKQPTPAVATFVLYVNGSPVGTKTKVLTVRSINDCPYAFNIKDVNGTRILRCPWMYAAYVNENHPWIDGLLSEALNTGTVPGFVGYQQGPQAVYRQVFAIWNDFQRRGFRYSSIAGPTGGSGPVLSQYVRFLEDSINTSQANCVDGSVLFASVLRRIGIDAVLVVIPGHCFLGFYLDQQHSNFCSLETTMMGNTALSQYSEDNTIAGGFAHLFGLETRNQASYRTFIAALREGNSEYHSNFEGLRRNVPGYGFIDIGACRKSGIRPINH